MIRRATPEDAAILARHRAALWDNENPDDPADDALRENLRTYFVRALAGNDVVAWLAFDEGEPVGTVTLMIHEYPPRKSGRDLRGYITAVFVAPHARRRGHAKRLMQTAIEHARERDIRRLTLRTTEQGRALYTSMGFAALEVLALKLR